MKLGFFVISAISFFYLTTSGRAEEMSFSLSPEISNIKGQAYENVYLDNQKISELSWQIKNVQMLAVNSRLSYQKMKFGLSYGNSFSQGNNQTMVDSDWVGTYGGKGCSDGNSCYNDWTHRSWSEEKTTQIRNFDANAYYDILSNFSLGLGFKQNTFKWEAWGTNYIYSSTDSFENLTGFRNESGTFSGKIISYQQKMNIPYIGAEINQPLFNKKLMINVRGAYSPWVNASTVDNHHLRDLTIKSSFNNGSYYSVGIGLEYFLLKNASVGMRYEFNQISENRGNATYYYSGRSPFSSRNAASYSNKYEKIGFFFKYIFNFQDDLIKNSMYL